MWEGGLWGGVVRGGLCGGVHVGVWGFWGCLLLWGGLLSIVYHVSCMQRLCIEIQV